jgi:hypothetical protein
MSEHHNSMSVVGCQPTPFIRLIDLFCIEEYFVKFKQSKRYQEINKAIKIKL